MKAKPNAGFKPSGQAVPQKRKREVEPGEERHGSFPKSPLSSYLKRHKSPVDASSNNVAFNQEPDRAPSPPPRPLRRQPQFELINPTGISNFDSYSPKPLRRDEDLVRLSPAGVPEIYKFHHDPIWRANRKNRPYIPSCRPY